MQCAGINSTNLHAAATLLVLLRLLQSHGCA
jgi:hypothetical protein